MPTINAKGKEVSEQILNKLKKDQAKQQSIYEKWLATQTPAAPEEEKKE